MAKDYYQTLGVSRTATKDEIKKAYRRLAHQHHPDKSGGDEGKFKALNEAYQVLSDDSKRAQYDQFGDNFDQAGAGGFSGFDFSGAGFGGINDIFEQFFRGSSGHTRSQVRRGDDVAVDLAITFEESARGITREVNIRMYQACSRCHGNGAEPGTKIATCATCHGSGEVRTTRETMFGAFSQASVCPDCHGEGKQATQICHQCRGEGRQMSDRKLEIKVPAGIADGQTLEIPGKGEAPARGGVSGNLYVNIHVQPHPVLKRDRNHVRVTQKVSFADAALGTKVKVPTLEGEQELEIPPGTQPSAELKLPNLGFPSVRSSIRGDQIITVEIEVPRKLSRRQKDLLEQLRNSAHKKHRLF